jgi:predicted 2-oxoglutarate/Fe(II)-dependent dioxygenase YbiX
VPPARSLILFEGKNYHGVNAVISGKRINYVLFFKDYDPDDEVIISEFDPHTYDTVNGLGTS